MSPNEHRRKENQTKKKKKKKVEEKVTRREKEKRGDMSCLRSISKLSIAKTPVEKGTAIEEKWVWEEGGSNER